MRAVGNWFRQNLDVNIFRVKRYRDRYHNEIVLDCDGIAYNEDTGESYGVVAIRIDRNKIGKSIFYDVSRKALVTISKIKEGKNIREEKKYLYLYPKKEWDLKMELELFAEFDKVKGLIVEGGQ